ncbi:metallophosphoesterase, partial [Mesorhizobium sp. M7A.F.Ca.CA.002.07.1.1]
MPDPWHHVDDGAEALDDRPLSMLNQRMMNRRSTASLSRRNFLAQA